MTAGKLLESGLPTQLPPLALSFDLDDTLWPIWVAIERAERVLHAWLVEHAPATAAQFDAAGLRAVRNAVADRHPEWGHDLSRIRRMSLHEALTVSGDDPSLTDAGFEVFFDARQQVTLYPEAREALDRLARRFPLIAVTNGNSELDRTGLDGLFQDSLSAFRVGVAKPNPRIFLAACERLGLAPGRVLHVGDDLMLDVNGALEAGLQAAWLRREVAVDEPAPPLNAPYRVFDNLTRLADALGC